MTEFLKQNRPTMLTIFRYLLLILLGFLILKTFFKNELVLSDYNEIIKTILTTTGVTVAIVITFLFSKLFSERNERIERKRLIDIESKKITAFRKICHFLKSSHEFWNPFGNLKNKLDNKYKYLKLNDYDSEKIEYERYRAFINEVNYGEGGGQAYVGLREIEGNERSGLVYYDSQLRKNYSLNEISLINDASNRVWSFLDRNRGELIAFDAISEGNRQEIEKNILLIHPEYEADGVDIAKLRNLFDEVHESITRKLFMLTQKNSRFLGRRFNLLLVDLAVFVFLIIGGIFIMSLDYSEFKKIYDFQVLITVFIIGVIDLLLNVVFAIRKELIIEDFYEL